MLQLRNVINFCVLVNFCVWNYTRSASNVGTKNFHISKLTEIAASDCQQNVDDSIGWDVKPYLRNHSLAVLMSMVLCRSMGEDGRAEIARVLLEYSSQGAVQSLSDDFTRPGHTMSLDDYFSACCNVQLRLQYKFRHFIFVSGERLQCNERQGVV